MDKPVVYFRKVRINESAGTATIIVADQPSTLTEQKLAGLAVATQDNAGATIGVLSLRDPETGNVMRADHPVIQQLKAKLKPGDAMPGFRITDNPITDRDTGEETGLYWVEAVAS